MRCAIVDTNIWIYLLEGRQEISKLNTMIFRGNLVPLLTPVVFAEVLGWQEIGSKEEKKIRIYFGMLHMPVDTFWMSRGSSKTRNLLQHL